MCELTNVMLEMIFRDERGILPYGHAKCYDSVNAWCQRILKRDPSVSLQKSEWVTVNGRVNADSLLTDAIWCQLWFAGKAKQDAQFAQPKRAFELLNQSCKMYDQILVQFYPKRLVNDCVHQFASPLTCALQYLECREKILQIVESERAQADLGAKGALNGTRACIQMICSRFSHRFTESDAMQTSADALYYKAASLKNSGKYAEAYPLFMEASKRYTACNNCTSDRALQEAALCKMSETECRPMDREVVMSLFQIHLVKL